MEAYDIAAPYMQGFYLSENSWRHDQDPQGYRLQTKESDDRNESDDDSYDGHLDETKEFLLKLYDEEMMTINEEDIDHEEEDPSGYSSGAQAEPPMVTPVPRLHFDGMVMQKILFAGDTPAQIAFGIDGLS